MKQAAALLFFSTLCCCFCLSELLDSAVNQKMDPKQCLAQPGTESNKPKIRFEVLPGVGFDNLRNLDAGQVIMWTYEDCRSTDDGKYLIPDSVFIVPVKESNLEIFAEVFQHWSSYTSATSRSINVDAGGGFGGFSISGKFSTEFQSMKTHQVQDKSITTRVQVRHTFYSAKLQPDAPLHPTFKSRLLQIAAHLQNNNTAVARYLGQLLVRDYGTHVLTSIDAGAALVKEDHVKNTFLNDTQHSKNKISASASASFFSFVHFDAGFSSEDSESSQQQYMGNRTSSNVRTHGGPAIRTNFTVRFWEEGLENELVAVDRSGDPLHYFITTATLAELPDPTIIDLSNLVKDAILLYYKFNTYKGCTKLGAPNFSFQANIDDGSCSPPKTNFTFGGVYQTCTSVAAGAGDLCPSLIQKNPLSGNFKCPHGYQGVLLHEGILRRSEKRRVCEKKCHGCGWWSRCCNTECGNRQYSSSARYQAFWCVALGEVPPDSGYLFGGLYTSTMVNPITSSRSCPLTFYPLRMVADMNVCVSDDYELGGKYALPFAGFFSCVTGNPLSTGSEPLTASAKVNGDEMQTLQHFMMMSGPQKWPKNCPKGFSQHLATIDDSCEINYCVRMGSLSDQGLPNVRRPPFTSQPGDNPNATDTLLIFGVAGKVWVKNDTSHSWVRIDKPDKGTLFTWAKELLGMTDHADGEDDDGGKSTGPRWSYSNGDTETGLSAGAAAGIAVAATVVCGVLLLAIISRIRRRGDRHRLTSPASESLVHTGYGSANDA